MASRRLLDDDNDDGDGDGSGGGDGVSRWLREGRGRMKVEKEKGVPWLPTRCLRRASEGCARELVIQSPCLSAELRFQFRSLAGSARPDSASFNGSIPFRGPVLLASFNGTLCIQRCGYESTELRGRPRGIWMRFGESGMPRFLNRR